MKSQTMKVMTLRLRERVIRGLDLSMKDLKLRRDEYLREKLEQEVETLSQVTPNSEVATRYLQMSKMERFSDRVKVGFKLPADLIDRINAVCADKRIPRDLFVESFLDFLVNGWPEEGVASPLVKAYEYLNDPYRDVDGSLNLYAERCSLSDEQARLLDELNNL
jgi:hypothetical protein